MLKVQLKWLQIKLNVCSMCKMLPNRLYSDWLLCSSTVTVILVFIFSKVLL